MRMLKEITLYEAILFLRKANLIMSKHSKRLPSREAMKIATPGSIRSAIENGLSLTATGEHGETVLMLAAELNPYPEVISLLIQAGAEVNATSKYGETSLMFAAVYNPNPEIVDILIQAGADVNATNKWGRKALDYARIRKKGAGKREIMDMLREAMLQDTRSLLCEAFMAEASPEEVRNLIQAGADVNAKGGRQRQTALYYARSREEEAGKREIIDMIRAAMLQDIRSLRCEAFMVDASPAEVRNLIQAGADVSATNERGKTALDYARKRQAEAGKREIMDMIRAGMLQDTRSLRCGAFMAEASPEEVRNLIQAGADVNAETDREYDYGSTVLMRAAAWNENSEVLRVLIDAGANVNARVGSNVTALMAAAKYNKNPKVLQVLLDAGSDINAETECGMTALDIARGRKEEAGKREIMNMLREAMLKDTRSLRCEAFMAEASPEEVRNLIQAGADINAKGGREGQTALMFAAEKNPNPEIVNILIQAGADVNAKGGWEGKTALMFAAENNPNSKILQVLIDAGADVNATAKDGSTALDCANARWKRGKEEIIRLLRKAGAKSGERYNDLLPWE